MCGMRHVRMRQRRACSAREHGRARGAARCGEPIASGHGATLPPRHWILRRQTGEAFCVTRVARCAMLCTQLWRASWFSTGDEDWLPRQVKQASAPAAALTASRSLQDGLDCLGP